jgi:hypothetical protein
VRSDHVVVSVDVGGHADDGTRFSWRRTEYRIDHGLIGEADR